MILREGVHKVSLHPGLGNAQPHFGILTGQLTGVLGRENGQSVVFEPALDMLRTPIDDLREKTREQLEATSSALKVACCTFITHSTGGLVVRPLLRSNPPGVPTLAIHLAVPWRGARIARLVPGQTARSLAPEVCNEDPAPLPGITEVAIIGAYDTLVPRASSTALDIKVIELPGDHGSLAWYPPAVRVICNLVQEHHRSVFGAPR